MEPVFFAMPICHNDCHQLQREVKMLSPLKKVGTKNKLVTIYLYFCPIMLNFVFFHAHRATLETGEIQAGDVRSSIELPHYTHTKRHETGQ